jgi:hypothetical protein
LLREGNNMKAILCAAALAALGSTSVRAGGKPARPKANAALRRTLKDASTLVKSDPGAALKRAIQVRQEVMRKPEALAGRGVRELLVSARRVERSADRALRDAEFQIIWPTVEASWRNYRGQFDVSRIEVLGGLGMAWRTLTTEVLTPLRDHVQRLDPRFVGEVVAEMRTIYDRVLHFSIERARADVDLLTATADTLERYRREQLPSRDALAQVQKAKTRLDVRDVGSRESLLHHVAFSGALQAAITRTQLAWAATGKKPKASAQPTTGLDWQSLEPWSKAFQRGSATAIRANVSATRPLMRALARVHARLDALEPQLRVSGVRALVDPEDTELRRAAMVQ